MKRTLACIVLGVVSSVAVGQILTEDQARDKLKLRQEERRIAATQPATHEEMDDVWAEINKLKNEVQGLREDLNGLRRESEMRREKDPLTNKTPDRHAPLLKPAGGGDPSAN